MAVSVSMIKAGAADRMARYYAEQKEVEEELAERPENQSKSTDELRAMARVEVARRHPEAGQSAAEAAAQERAVIQRERTAGSTTYYATAEEDQERLRWIRGDRVDESVTTSALAEHFLGTGSYGRRLDDPQLQTIKKVARLAEYTGELTPDAIAALRAGVHPDDGATLSGEAATFAESVWAAKDRKASEVSAVDTTFSAPKGVSLLAAFGDRATAEAVIEAQEKAVEAVLAWGEGNGVIRARRGRDGVEKISAVLTDVARKTELTSREGDPQLHCHTIMSAYVLGEDGRRSALDGQALMGASAAMDAAYRRELSEQLQRSLGVRLEVDPDSGKLDRVAGIDRDLELRYSTRRQQINETLAERTRERERLEKAMGGAKHSYERAFRDQQAGETLTDAEQRRADVYEAWLGSGTTPAAAALDTRNAKAEESESQARARWEADQTAPDGVKLLKSAQEAAATGMQVEWSEVEEATFHERLGETLTKSAAAFSAKEAWAAALHMAPASLSDEQLAESVSRFLGDVAVGVGESQDVAPQVGDVWVDKTARYTTEAVVAERNRIVDMGRRLSTQTIDSVRRGDLQAAAKIAESYNLSEDQEQILSAATTGQRLVSVEGPAGSGKSHVLAAVAEHMRREHGASVSVLSTKADLAAGLAAEIGADRGFSLEKATMQEADRGLSGIFEKNHWAQGLSDSQAETFFDIKRQMREATTDQERVSAEAAMTRWAERLPTQQQAEQTAASRDRLERQDKAAKFLGDGDARKHLYEKRQELIDAAAENPNASVRIDRNQLQVLIMDEAAMSGNRHLERLYEWACQQPNVQIIQVGDMQQLSSVERGGAYRALVEAVKPIQLQETRRAHAEWEREAQLEMRALSYDESEETRDAAAQIVQRYVDQGRVQHVGEDAVAAAIESGQVEASEKRPDLLVAAERAADWWDAQRSSAPDDESMVLTPTKLLQTQVAAAIQQRRFDDPADSLTENTKSLTVALDETLQQQLHVGEPVMVRSNISELGLRNGQLGTVKNIRAERVKIEVTDERGKRFHRWIDQQKLQKGALGLAYTSTAHKAQGATVDRALYLHDTGSQFADRHMVYPSMTRGKAENQVLLVGGDSEEAEASLANAMSHSEQTSPMRGLQLPVTEEERQAVRRQFPKINAEKVDDFVQQQRAVDARRERDAEAQRQMEQRRQQQRLSAERSRRRDRGMEIAA